MSRHLSRARVRRSSTVTAAVISASAALAGVLAPVPAADAGMTVNLQFPGGGTAMYIGPGQTNTSIPVQVWATVTGSTPITPTPTGGNSSSAATQTGVFDGLQYLYYNVLNSNSTGNEIAGSITSDPLNSTLGFNANGSQVGAIPNAANGISVGSASSITSVAKPRSSPAVFDNYESYNQSTMSYQVRGGDNTNIRINSSTSVSFLVQTLNYTPTSYTARNKTTFTIQVPSSTFTASAATDLSPANWFQDITNQNLGQANQPSGGTNVSGTPTVGTQVVIQDTLAGDINLDGTVNSVDLGILASHFNLTGQTYSTGDLNGDGVVNSIDLGILAANFNMSIVATPSAVVSEIQTLAAEDDALPAINADLASNPTFSAVPEPASATVLAIAAIAMTARRRRHA